jgi:hypothetical protein
LSKHGYDYWTEHCCKATEAYNEHAYDDEAYDQAYDDQSMTSIKAALRNVLQQTLTLNRLGISQDV